MDDHRLNFRGGKEIKGKWRTKRRHIAVSCCPRHSGQRTTEYPGVKAARILRVTAWRGWDPFYTQVRTVRANRVITTSQKFLRTALVISIGAIGHFAPLPVVKTLPRLPKDSAKFLWPYRLWLWTHKPRRKSNGNSRVNRKGGPGSSGRRAEPIDYIR